ncbi:MAG: hypothetical protein EZS28_034538, partial [Streblomastix strix]
DGLDIEYILTSKAEITAVVVAKAGLLYGYFQSEEKMKIQKSKLITFLAEQLDGKQLANGTDVICVEAQTDTGYPDIGDDDWVLYPPVYIKFPPIK